MIRPIDIQEKEFTRAVRGYKEEEVNEFLDEITMDLERLLDELRQTKEENSHLVGELERYRGSEGTVLETLEAAKTLMSDISSSAEKRADILLKNAELDAQLMTKEAKEMSDRIAEESEAIKARFIDFRTRYKKLLQSELQRFESLSGEMFPELGVDDFDDLPEMMSNQSLNVEKPPRGTVRNIKY
ncbi:MAG: DivIVA domain-containing protein [Clostridiales bacterium]|nr:DivIVA domain-containing protein [Clostridiales bacterium]